MPLLDHFHPPLSETRKWEGFHSHWTSSLAAQLNAGLLPPHHFAEPQVSHGRIEVDVATGLPGLYFGMEGLVADEQGGFPSPGGWQRAFLFAPALTIGGGTTEVQKNILAQRVLGLPRQ